MVEVLQPSSPDGFRLTNFSLQLGARDRRHCGEDHIGERESESAGERDDL